MDHPFKPIIDVIREANKPSRPNLYPCYYCGEHFTSKQLNEQWLIDGGEGSWIDVCKSCDGEGQP
jgi:hypothetical protein